MRVADLLVQELLAYALSKRGAERVPGDEVVLPAAKPWMHFFRVTCDGAIDGGKEFAHLPVTEERLRHHREKYPTIRQSGWMERYGHVYMEVPLHGDFTLEFWYKLIDESYALMWQVLEPDDRVKIDLTGSAYDETKILDLLIELHDLKKHQKALRALARPALLLRTRECQEDDIPLGATKIGGRPDLPAAIAWPAYRTGKPLAFLAQFNLADVAKVGSPIKGLSDTGMLWVFSAWAWMEEGDGDPHTPDDSSEDEQEKHGWNVISQAVNPGPLARRDVPQEVNSFQGAPVELMPVLSLPHDSAEPVLAALRWSEEEYDRYESLQLDYHSMQERHFRNWDTYDTCDHRLGGYGYYEQYFPEEVIEKKLAMFLQIGTDGNTCMGWGDGGALTFHADGKALAKGRFERLWVTCQGG